MNRLRGMGATTALRRAATDLVVGTSTAGSLQKPISIQFPVNDTCNSACRMCNIWQQSERNPITPDEVGDLLRSDLFDQVRTVGLNGGEPTLRKDLAELARVAADRLPRLQKVAVITNALHPPSVLRRLGEVREALHGTGVALDVMVSLDGWGEIHDVVRGKPGNFEAALEVIEAIRTDDLADHLRLGATIVDINVTEIEELRFQAERRGLPINFRMGIPHQRLYVSPGEPFSLSTDQRDHLLRFLANLAASAPDLDQRAIYSSILGQIAYGSPRAVGCDFQGRAITLTSRREIGLCPVVGSTVGRVDPATCSHDYFAAQSALDAIVQHDCDSCMHDYRGPRTRRSTLGFGAEVLGLASRAELLRDRIRASGRPRDAVMTIAAGLDDLRTVRIATTRPADQGGKTLIVGWWGTETIGDQAILGGIAGTLTEELSEDAPIEVVSVQPFVTDETLRALDLPNWRVTRPEVAFDDLARGSVSRVLVGGGPLMSIRPLKQIEALLRLARRGGAHTAVVGCGIGPLRGRWAERSVERILAASDFVGLRDEASVRWARGRGHDAVDIGDPATWYLANRSRQPSRHGCVIALRRPDPLYAHIGANRGEPTAFATSAARALRDIDGPLEPLAMHTYHVGGDDRWFLRDLSELHPALPIRWRRRNVAEAIDLIGRSDLLIAGRYHALVFGATLGVPTVAVDYSGPAGKIASFAATHGLSAARVDAWAGDLDLGGAVAAAARVDWVGVAEQIAARALEGRRRLTNAIG